MLLRLRATLSLLFLCALTQAIAAPSPSPFAPAPKAAPSLQVEPAPFVNIGAPYLAEYRFGKVTLLDTQTVSCSVSLRNAGKSPVTINKVETSCGCTSAVIGDGYDAAMPYKLDPGGTVRLRASILSSHLVPGPVRKTVTVDSSDGDLTITLIADAVGPAQFVDDDVSLGNVKLGQKCSRNINVMLDNRVADIPVRLVSGDKNVVVTQLPSPSSTKAAGRLLRYNLSLATPPRLGSIYSMLTLLPSQSVTPDGHAYPSADLPVSGRVVAADIDTSPTQIVFGLVKFGVQESTKMILTAKGKRWQNATVTSNSPLVKWVPETASLTKAGYATSGHVMLSPKAPEGDVAAQLTVTAKSGECFQIPVFATVSKFAVQ